MKFKANWIAIGDGLTADKDNNIVVNLGPGLEIDPNTKKVVPDSTIVRTNQTSFIKSPQVFLTFPQLPDAVPPNDLAPVTKKYLDSKVNGLIWRWPVRCQEQFCAGPTGGIRPCVRLIVVNSALFQANTNIYCSFTTPDGTKRFFELNVISQDITTVPAGQINIYDAPTNDELAQRILAAIKSLAEAGDTAAAFLYNYSVVYADRVYYIYNNPNVITDFKVWVSDVLDPAVKIDLPSHDNIGRSFKQLLNNETHFAEENDVAYTWDLSSTSWIPVTGSSSVPYATKDTAGKVRPLDGLSVSTGDIEVALADPSGLELVGTSPNKTLAISDSVAGDGLKITDKVISIDFGYGLGINATTHQLEIDTSSIIDTTKGLSLNAANQIQINLKANGGLLFDPTTGSLYVDPNLGEQYQAYAVVLDTVTYAQGYIILPQTPVRALDVSAFIGNGLRLLNQVVLDTYGITTATPDFTMCPESGYERYFVFANGVTLGTWTSSGLSGDIVSGDLLIITYEA